MEYFAEISQLPSNDLLQNQKLSNPSQTDPMPKSLLRCKVISLGTIYENPDMLLLGFELISLHGISFCLADIPLMSYENSYISLYFILDHGSLDLQPSNWKF